MAKELKDTRNSGREPRAIREHQRPVVDLSDNASQPQVLDDIIRIARGRAVLIGRLKLARVSGSLDEILRNVDILCGLTDGDDTREEKSDFLGQG